MADNTTVDAPREGAPIQGHLYDGIQEYDNPMPSWWLWILYATIIWSPLYIAGLHFSDVIPSYEEDLRTGQAELQEVRSAWEASNPSVQVDADFLATFVGDSGAEAAGAEVYAASCAACHGPEGGGLIGPNLTDRFWIHGPSDLDVFEVISEGVIEKGMAPWASILSAEERAQVVAYIRSLAGTSPAGAKAPEGEPAPGEA